MAGILRKEGSGAALWGLRVIQAFSLLLDNDSYFGNVRYGKHSHFHYLNDLG